MGVDGWPCLCFPGWRGGGGGARGTKRSSDGGEAKERARGEEREREREGSAQKRGPLSAVLLQARDSFLRGERGNL